MKDTLTDNSTRGYHLLKQGNRVYLACHYYFSHTTEVFKGVKLVFKYANCRLSWINNYRINYEYSNSVKNAEPWHNYFLITREMLKDPVIKTWVEAELCMNELIED